MLHHAYRWAFWGRLLEGSPTVLSVVSEESKALRMKLSIRNVDLPLKGRIHHCVQCGEPSHANRRGAQAQH
jgi:hypothetical protein